jgi:hypothetical protein
MEAASPIEACFPRIEPAADQEAEFASAEGRQKWSRQI